MRVPLVIVFASMTYAVLANASAAEASARPYGRDSFTETSSGLRADASEEGRRVSDTRDQDTGHQTQSHREPEHAQPHSEAKTHGTDRDTNAEHHDEGTGHDEGAGRGEGAGHGDQAEHHGGHKEAFLFRVREAYLRKKGELRLGFDFGYIRGKEEPRIYKISGFREKHKHKERIRYGDYEYLLKIDYGITDRLQVTGIVPYFSIREHIDGEPFFAKSHLGDSKVELWYAFTEEDENTPAISGAFQLTLPTGDYKKGIGNGRFGYGGSLAITKDFGKWVLYGDLGYNLTPGAKIRWSDRRDSSHHDLHGFSYGVGAVYKLPGTWRFSVELAGKTAQEIELDNTDWVTQLAVIPGLRRGVSLGSMGVLEYGVGFPIGLTHDSEDWGVLVKLDWALPAP